MNRTDTPYREGIPGKKNFFERHSLTLKLIFIGFLLLMLLIPLEMVRGLIHQRETLSQSAFTEMADKWSGQQYIIGPILTIPYYKTEETVGATGVKTTKQVRGYIDVLPEKLKIDGNLKTRKLQRGIYDAVVYNSAIRLTGTFLLSEQEIRQLKRTDLDSAQAQLSIDLTDLGGLEKYVTLQWDGDSSTFTSGENENKDLASTISSPVDAAKVIEGKTPVHFSINLFLRGSNAIYFAPLGRTTDVTLSSDCPTPSFTGNFLPDTRDITKNGFKCTWSVIGMNRNYPQVMENLSRQNDIRQSAFGVELLVPVAQYQMSMRAVKYGALIILLTFASVFFAEIALRRNIHPLQYLLVGLALVLFYSLLVALSEHLNFGLSYLIASAMITAMLYLYARAVLRKKKAALAVAGILVLLYLYIYVLMQMETYALLAGSAGLFAILAGIMFYSQKMDIFKRGE